MVYYARELEEKLRSNIETGRWNVGPHLLGETDSLSNPIIQAAREVEEKLRRTIEINRWNVGQSPPPWARSMGH
jgi:hypothetical protein